MTDKSLIKRRFQRSLKTYDENAIAQKQMADILIEMLPERKYHTILEIGCSTGILSEKIKEKLVFEKFYANDIVADSKKYIDEIIKNNIFMEGDIEKIKLQEKYDLIISNACLQWCSNIKDVLQKLYNHLNDNGVLAVSVFGDDNLKEIKNVFGLRNNTFTYEELKKIIVAYNGWIKENKIILYFGNLLDILKHIKYTGANAVKCFKLTKSSFADYEKEYKKLYFASSGLTLTYNPVYILIYKDGKTQS